MMKNENRAVFDRAPEPINYAFRLPGQEAAGAEDDNAGIRNANILGRLLLWMATRLKQWRDANALLELTDQQLKDIGISRCQAYGRYERYRRIQPHSLERHRL